MLNITNLKEEFFLENPELSENQLVLLTIGGDHARGIDTSTSPIAIRGCMLNEKREILLGESDPGRHKSIIGVSNNKDKTTIIKDVNTFIWSLVHMNLENFSILGVKLEHLICMNSVGYEILNNRRMFMSRMYGERQVLMLRKEINEYLKVMKKMSLSKLERKLVEERELHELIAAFNERCKEFYGGYLQIKLLNRLGNEEVCLNADIKNYPIKRYRAEWLEIKEIMLKHDCQRILNIELNERSTNRQIMEFIRQYLTYIDLFEQEEIITYRKNDIALLKSILKGDYTNTDYSLHKSFYDMLDELSNRLDYAIDNTSLPMKPDIKKVEELLVSINERVVLGKTF